MNDYYELFDGDIVLWIEQEIIHIKAVDTHGDPVELTPPMCKEFIEMLSDLVEIVKKEKG